MNCMFFKRGKIWSYLQTGREEAIGNGARWIVRHRDVKGHVNLMEEHSLN